MKVKMLQYIFLAVRIHEGNILKHNIPLDFLPIVLIGRKGVPVLQKHIGPVHHMGLLLQQVHHPFDVRLAGNQVCQQPGQLLNRFKYDKGIGDEHRQCAEFYEIFLHHIAALCQDHRRGH